jgi:hypothetical protein
MRRGQHHGHARQCEQVFLIDETQLAFVYGISTEPNPKRVQHGVAFGERVLDFRNLVLQQALVTRAINRHRFSFNGDG